MAKNWTQIEIKFRISMDLDLSIFTFNNSLSTKLTIKWNMWRKIENLIGFF